MFGIGRPKRFANVDWQHEPSGEQHDHVHRDLGAQVLHPREQVRIEIAREQSDLEERHRRVPDLRGAAQERRHHARKQWL